MGKRRRRKERGAGENTLGGRRNSIGKTDFED
jgi:hypothetical protein